MNLDCFGAARRRAGGHPEHLLRPIQEHGGGDDGGRRDHHQERQNDGTEDEKGERLDQELQCHGLPGVKREPAGPARDNCSMPRGPGTVAVGLVFGEDSVRSEAHELRVEAQDLIAGLNPPQASAVIEGEGPILVLAGAGSGKTRVLTRRIAHLISERSVAPWRIIAVTFTNKAAAEMRQRVAALVGDAGRSVTMGTFHAICSRMLRRDPAQGRSADFTIYDSDDQRRLMKQALGDAGVTDPRLTPAVALDAISRLKSELIGPEAFRPSGYLEELVHRVYPVYEQLLQRSNAYDFDDLIFATVRLFRDEPAILERYASRYLHVLVDEYQDTNHAQYVLVSLLASQSRNLFAVGDPDQSIYGWRGADIRNILQFEAEFQDARTITLDQNYRSTQNILDAAHAIIVANPERPDKRLWTDSGPGALLRVYEARNGEEEAQFIAREVRRLIHRRAGEAFSCAVMYRTNAQSRALEDAFIREGVAYRIVGSTKFYERREVKDALAYLRFVANPSDGLSLQRIINVPPRKIGAKSLQVLGDWAAAHDLSLWDAVGRAAEIPGLRAAAIQQLAVVTRLFRQMRQFASSHNVVETLDWILEGTGYLRWLESEPEGLERRANVEELRTVAELFEDLEPSEGLQRMLEHVALVSDADLVSESAVYATLMTLHLAKGLEFDAVFLTGMEEGLFPHARGMDDAEERSELEEERRLCYVGFTRARKQLYLTYAMRRTLFGRTQANPPSRFLLDVPEDLLDPQSNLPRRAAARSIVSSFGFESETTPTPVPVISEASFRRGDRVYHKHFGLGTVLASQLTGGDEEISVEFRSKTGPTTKKLSVMYSGIEHA